MRYLVLLSVDAALILLSTLLAFFLRENFEISARRLVEFAPYLLATLAAALAIFPFAGLNRTVWRFSSFSDNLTVNAAVAAAVAGAASLAFAYNRLDGVARSLPFLQYLTSAAFLTGARALHRLAHEFGRDRKARPAVLEPLPENKRAKTGLVLGVTRLAEAYLRTAAELLPKRIRIAGVVASKERHTGRYLAAHKVLGYSENLCEILDTLQVHGVNIEFIAVAAPFQLLSAKAQEALIAAAQLRNIELRFLAEDWGLSRRHHAAAAAPAQQSALPEMPKPRFEIPSAMRQTNAQRRYWKVKRAIDFSGALVLVLLLSPFMLLTALLVAASLGLPVTFWQERQGLGGRTFRVYKFRTMRPSRGIGGVPLCDDERVSRVGTFLRRLRFDELPQLFNILRGDMSFIGPRPLLDHEQSKACISRLLIRPGLTGWAQVVGGRDITPADKAALDVWYVCNASLALDVKIVLKTIPFVLFGVRIDARPINQAWRELFELGALKEGVSQNS
jgi:lipopolysaccharide/colanic/teichoic acid biosynthesis glycosyltransferase